MSRESILIEALQKIAHGRRDNGRSLAGPTSMSIARDALSRAGLDWSSAALRIKLGPAPGYSLPSQRCPDEENETSNEYVSDNGQFGAGS
jgi:hypothetical protein